MTNREKLARQWAEDLKDGVYGSFDDESSAAADYILATTTPPTMADMEWDYDNFPGTGALTKNGRLWIMRDDAGDAIDCISTDLAEIAFVAKEGLTPNGKRYELREVTKPDHPEVLRTVEDYQKAPVWTVVGDIGAYPFCKGSDHRWHVANSAAHFGSAHLAEYTYMSVIRWGRGDEA